MKYLTSLINILALLFCCACQEQLTLNAPGAVASAPTSTVVSLGSVTAKYDVAPNWNDYFVKSDPTLECSGVEVDCGHGGELKKVTVTGKSLCTNLTMVDSLGAFDWSCEVGAEVQFTGRFKATLSVADLVDASAWKTNSVRLFENGVEIARTSEAIWYGNTVLPLPSALSATQILSTPSVVYVVSATPTGPIKGYNLNADKIAVAIKEGVTLTSDGTTNTDASTRKYNAAGQKTIFAVGSQKFVSIEGTCDWSMGVRPSYWVLDGGGANTTYLIAMLSSKYVRLKKLSLRNSTSHGMHSNYLFSPAFDRLTIADMTSYGTQEGNTVFGRWTNVNAFTVGYSLVDLNSPSYTLFENIHSQDHNAQLSPNYNAGIWMNNGNYMTFKNIVVKNSNCAGMSVRNTNNSTFTNLTLSTSGSSGPAGCSAEGGVGLHVSGGSNNVYKNLKLHSNLGSGISLVSASGQHFRDVISTNNGLNAAYTGKAGIRETGTGTGNTYTRVIVTNNAAEGMILGHTGSSVNQVTAAHNGTSGITVGAASKAISAATVAYNGAYGINQSFTNAATIYHNIVAYKNTLSGIFIANDSTGATLSNISSLSNQTYGVEVGTASAPGALVKVVGNLVIADNQSGKCLLPASVFGFGSTSCALSTPSTGVLTDLGGTLVNSFIGASTSDAANSSDLSGIKDYASLTDWVSFETAYRGWGRLAGSKGACLVGAENCQIWDFKLKDSDTFLRNTSFDAQAQNGLFVNGALCPVNLSGSHFVTSVSSLRFLLLAIEDMDSSLGNRNGLCESGEECLYMPNFGAYQGSGSRVSCLFDAEGTGVSPYKMSGYSSN